MAGMAVLAAQSIVEAGIAPSFAAANAGGDRVQPGPGVYIEIINGGGAPITVTVDCKTPSNYGTDADLGPISVPATARRKIPVNDARRFGSPTDGLADIAYSGVTSVTVGAFRAPV